MPPDPPLLAADARSGEGAAKRLRHRNLASGNSRLRPIIEEALSTGNLREVRPGGIVFTDDLAPVERMIDQIILGYIRGSR